MTLPLLSVLFWTIYSIKMWTVIHINIIFKNHYRKIEWRVITKTCTYWGPWETIRATATAGPLLVLSTCLSVSMLWSLGWTIRQVWGTALQLSEAHHWRDSGPGHRQPFVLEVLWVGAQVPIIVLEQVPTRCLKQMSLLNRDVILRHNTLGYINYHSCQSGYWGPNMWPVSRS